MVLADYMNWVDFRNGAPVLSARSKASYDWVRELVVPLATYSRAILPPTRSLKSRP